eukprot:2662762-Rhodomonas_salina.2
MSRNTQRLRLHGGAIPNLPSPTSTRSPAWRASFDGADFAAGANAAAVSHPFLSSPHTLLALPCNFHRILSIPHHAASLFYPSIQIFKFTPHPGQRYPCLFLWCIWSYGAHSSSRRFCPSQLSQDVWAEETASQWRRNAPVVVGRSHEEG